MTYVLLQDHKEIGGYFGFDLTSQNQFPYATAKKYCSARAAFYDLVQNIGVQTIWMPRFICDTMLKPLELLNIKIKFYDLDSNFFPQNLPSLNRNEFFFYVNYFGICVSNQKKLMEQYPLGRLIFDHSQAFFMKPFANVHTIYSPRKFLPVADGGLLVTDKYLSTTLDVKAPEELIQQYQHLFKRFINSAQDGYAQFQCAESSLNDCIPKKISPITEVILNNLDYASYKQKRMENFKFLHSKLSNFNQITLNLNEIESPLTYPFLWNERFSELLISKKIYVPTYWNDCLIRVQENSFEHTLIHNVTHLVCDHRYSLSDMQYQIDQIMEYL